MNADIGVVIGRGSLVYRSRTSKNERAGREKFAVLTMKQQPGAARELTDVLWRNHLPLDPVGRVELCLVDSAELHMRVGASKSTIAHIAIYNVVALADMSTEELIATIRDVQEAVNAVAARAAVGVNSELEESLPTIIAKAAQRIAPFCKERLQQKVRA